MMVAVSAVMVTAVVCSDCSGGGVSRCGDGFGGGVGGRCSDGDGVLFMVVLLFLLVLVVAMVVGMVAALF